MARRPDKWLVTTIDTTSVPSALQMIEAKDADETGVSLTTTMEIAARKTIVSSIAVTAAVRTQKVAATVGTGALVAGTTRVPTMRATTKRASMVRARTTHAVDNKARIRMAAVEVAASPDGVRAAARIRTATRGETCTAVAVPAEARVDTMVKALVT
jgi:hypothetical protein